MHRRLFSCLKYLSLLVILAFVILTLYLPFDTITRFKTAFLPKPDVLPHVWEERANEVRAAFLHAYHGYERYALPRDELLPLSRSRINNFNGWGVTMFDSLDTMILMGLQDEYERALVEIDKVKFSVSGNVAVPYFETVIRYLGGLLSAHALSGDSVLLRRADELATLLDPVFKSGSGLAFYSVNPTAGQPIGPEVGILSEFATLQLEYTYLAKLTGKKKYFDRANNIIQTFSKANLTNTGGMLPIKWNLTSGEPVGYRLSVGSQADSAHEYLLKQHLLTSKTDRQSLDLYIRASTHILTNLLFLSPVRKLLFVSDTNTPTYERRAEPSGVLEHLSCFLPGLLALGASRLDLDTAFANLVQRDDEGGGLTNYTAYGVAGRGYDILRNGKHNVSQVHLWAAEGLAETCWIMYADQQSGLAPDEILMHSNFATGGASRRPAGGFWGWLFGLWSMHGSDTSGAGSRKEVKTTGKWQSEVGGDAWLSALEIWQGNNWSGSLPPGVGEQKRVLVAQDNRSGRIGGQTASIARDYAARRTGYLLRPETVESMYLLYRITGDIKWRERGWEVFQALERETRTPVGYANLKTVEGERGQAVKEDSMPSYFLAETLKYLYLLFSNDDPLPLDKWVFNTEAHPLPIFGWTEIERKQFGIDV